LKAINLSPTLAAMIFLSACATSPKPVIPNVDLQKIHKISVVPFEGTGGREATDELVRQLLAAGLEVTDGQHPGDAVLRGAVTDYKPTRTLIVFLGKTTVLEPGGQPVSVNNPIVSPGTAQVTPDAAGGAPNAQVASVSASVTVAAQLMVAASGVPVWSGSYSYEALDMPEALRIVSGVIVQSMAHLIPAMSRHPS
jgi:hypothetical protein